jgi:ATP-dependent RNA helicase DDX21
MHKIIFLSSLYGRDGVIKLGVNHFANQFNIMFFLGLVELFWFASINCYKISFNGFPIVMKSRIAMRDDNRFDNRPKAYGPSSGGRKSFGSSNYKGKRDSGGGGKFFGRSMDSSLKLRFKTTIKIDPELKTPLSEMKFSEKTFNVLKEKGFEEMTPVQSQSYDLVYSGVDVVARSRTGTGKTFAFGLPLIEKIVAAGLNKKRDDLPLILIIEPTRELALQVSQELQTVCRVHQMKVLPIFGGDSFSAQERALRSGVHIVVATPGRALDHITRRTINLSNVKHVVLDEGDTMLEMGFQEDVESILRNVKQPGESSRRAAKSSLDENSWSDELDDEDLDSDEDSNETNKPNSDVQMLLFSATMPGWICSMTDKHMDNPVFLDAVQEGESRLSDTITHLAIRIPSSFDRLDSVRSYMEDLILTKSFGGQTIVFTNTKQDADNLLSSNCFTHMRAQVLHGDISQFSRQTTIKQFKDRRIDVLVATDVAARGLDIAGVDLVVHTSPPSDPDTFVHRSGRTGRAGRNGTSILLYTPTESRKLSLFENSLNFRFTLSSPPSSRDVSNAIALYATKRVSEVNPTFARHFVPHAKNLIKSILSSTLEKNLDAAVNSLSSSINSQEDKEEGGAGLAVTDVDDAVEEVDALYTQDDIENVLSRCLAALSNRNSIVSRFFKFYNYFVFCFYI